MDDFLACFEFSYSLLVTFVPEDDDLAFWYGASASALAKIWDNDEDDVYAELLEGNEVPFGLKQRVKTKKRYADVVVAAMARATGLDKVILSGE